MASLVAVVLGGSGVASGSAAADPEGRRSYTGTIDGADYRVEMPERWNGTLVLYSHGYYPPEFGGPPWIMLANRVETEAWLLDHGYALAASNFRGVTGFAVEQAMHDQIALLDWVAANIGRPSRTIAAGMSMGGGVSVLLAERNPHRFAGVLTTCGEFDFNGSWNTALDISFAVRTLLAPDQGIELVRASDPARSTDLLRAAVTRAVTDSAGRARLALAGALGGIPAWASGHRPRPTDLVERITQQAVWIDGAYLWGMGPTGRVDLEARAGGNPSSNTGIDYRYLLARSAERDLVRQAYQAADLNVEEDLRLLAAAPRITADPAALSYLDQLAVRGTAHLPVVTMHNTGDGGAIANQERWYAEQVRRSGDASRLRQLYVDRGSHCAFSAAEEIVALQILLERIDSGRWPDTGPDRLNAAAGAFGEPYQLVLDLLTFEDRAMPPAFVRYTPPAFLRPSR
jgi:pimeloyl-ACP methyl ester carboxylesterase